METWVKVVIGGAVAYFAYEYFYGTPSSWTAAGGTAAQWTAIGATGQSAWNAAPASAQTAANVALLVQAAPATTTASSSTMPASYLQQALAAYPMMTQVQAQQVWAGLSAAQQQPFLQNPNATGLPPTSPAAGFQIGQATPSGPCLPGFVFSPTAAGCVQQGSAGGNMGGTAPSPVHPTSLAALATAIQQAAASDGAASTMTSAQWNYYAGRFMGTSFPNVSAPDGQLTFSAWWGYAAPIIATDSGLAGYGMGDYVPMGTDPQSFIQGGAMSPFYMDANTDDRSWN